MQADFSVELGHDDPVLELPWSSDDPSVCYYDLKSCPELVRQISEAVAHPELSAFLTRINAQDSPLETAKCDLWQSREISAEEEIFGAEQKFVSYIDLVFTDETIRGSFEKHEKFAGELCQLLNRAPDMPATVELILRRCYYRPDETRRGQPISKDAQIAKTSLTSKDTQIDEEMHEGAAVRRSGDPKQENSGGDAIEADGFSTGFYITAYVSGFGDDDREPQRRWAIAIALLRHALVQLSSQF